MDGDKMKKTIESVKVNGGFNESENTSLYNERYLTGYRDILSGYEIARWNALNHFIRKVVRKDNVKKVLDYGCGNGLFYPLFRSVFPEAEVFGADISSVAIEQIKKKYPEISDRLNVINDDSTNFPDGFFDVVVSVEVMEHVADLDKYLTEIKRVLNKGGLFIWTTPCANKYSIEHIYSKLTGQIELSSIGCIRWKWEDPTHLRRLTSQEVQEKLEEIGFEDVEFRFRAHVFSFVFTRLISRIQFLSSLFEKVMNLDYLLFRRFSNGASMIGVAKKK